MEWTLGDHRLSDDASQLDLDEVYRWLSETYWAKDRPKSMLETSVKHSLCLGLFQGSRQIGFSRAVTDHATFTWIADVIVAPEFRGRGLGKWMVKTLMEHPAIQTRTQLLRTLDAHGLYESLGFERAECLRRYVGGPGLPGM